MPPFSDSAAAPRRDDADGADGADDVDGALTRLHAQLRALEEGDRAVLALFYAQYGDLVFRTALRLTGHRSDAEDVTHDVFVRLASSVLGFTGRHEQFPRWLRRVAVRAALMHMRSGRRRREVNAESIVALMARSEDAVTRLTIEDALARLSDEHRTVFLLKEVEGYDHAEISELVGISVANSEVRLHRARRHLRELLRDSR